MGGDGPDHHDVVHGAGHSVLGPAAACMLCVGCDETWCTNKVSRPARRSQQHTEKRALRRLFHVVSAIVVGRA